MPRWYDAEHDQQPGVECDVLQLIEEDALRGLVVLCHCSHVERELEGACLEFAGDRGEPGHLVPVREPRRDRAVVVRRFFEGALVHRPGAQGGVTDVGGVVDGFRQLVDDVEVFREVLP